MTEFTSDHVVRLADTDAAGIVYFARALEWCHAAYEEWLESIGMSLGENLPSSQWVLPIVHAEVTHARPLRLGDRLVIQMRTAKIGRTSYSLGYELKHGDDVAIRAQMTHVCIVRATSEPVEIPAALRSSLERLGGI